METESCLDCKKAANTKSEVKFQFQTCQHTENASVELMYYEQIRALVFHVVYGIC